MATSKTTAPRARPTRKKQGASVDGVASLYRKFREADREWRKADEAYTLAVETAQAKYPKPPSALEQILLLNRDALEWEVYRPIARHEAALLDLCGRGNRDGNQFGHNYELLKQWRSWQAACEMIDRDAHLSELRSEAEGAEEKRNEAFNSFENAPAKSLESILLKLKYVEDRLYDKRAPDWRRNSMLRQAIRELKAGAGQP
jgi:hypothetical protein